MRFLSTVVASVIGTLVGLGLLFFLTLLFFAAIVSATDKAPGVPDGAVLTLPIAGPIVEIAAPDPFMRLFSNEAVQDLREVKQALRKAAVDDRIAGVWLQVQGVESGWAALEELREALDAFRASGKPLIASSDDYMVAEAEYFLMSAADSVFAAPQGLFEFNGFYLNAEFYHRLLQKLDVEPQVVRAGKYKGAVEPFLREDLSPENEEQLQALLSNQNTRFMEAVATSRRLPAGELEAVASEAAIFTAEGALAAGLLDGLRYRDEVIDAIKARLGLLPDDDLEEVAFANYRHVSDREAGLTTSGTDEIAVVYAVGTIVSGDSGLNTSPLAGDAYLGAETFNRAMQEARERESVKAVVVRIDSPGGFAPAADAMWREIRLTTEEKPVVISMGNLAASGGYWMATAGDTIVADPLTITGSIGVFSVFFDAGDFFSDKLGITFDAVTTSPYADMFSAMRPLRPAERQLLERSTEETYQTFLSRVAEGRPMDEAQADAVGQGRVWSGADALEVGLVDVLGGLETAIGLAAERAGLAADAYKTRTLPQPRTVLEELAATMNAQAVAGWQRLRLSAPERAVLGQLRTLRGLSREHGTVQARLPYFIDIR